MKLHDLTVGQRFTFSDKHRGKTFEVIAKLLPHASIQGIKYKDVATGEIRTARSNRKTFRMEVELVTDERVITLSNDEAELLTTILHEAYLEVSEKGGSEELKSEINKLYLKITGK